MLNKMDILGEGGGRAGLQKLHAGQQLPAAEAQSLRGT
jgi:hypothetical protein